MIWFLRKSIAVAFSGLLVLLGITGWVFWRHHVLPPQDLMRDFKEVDFFVNEFLVERGFSDSSIIEQYRKEIKKNGFLWVESHKTIRYPHSAFKRQFLAPLERKLKSVKGSFVITDTGTNSLDVAVGKDAHTFHTFKFVTPVYLRQHSKKKTKVL